MQRTGSQFKQYVRRIPSDLIDRIGGLRLAVPVGDHLAEIRLATGRQLVRGSLRTNNPTEVKARNAAVDSYLDSVFANLRADKPIPISHMQATALAGEAYRAWAQPQGKERTLSVEFTHDRKPVFVEPSNDPELWEASAEHIADLMASADESEVLEPLEKAFGSIVDRLLIAKGIASTDAKSRETILVAVGRALQDAFRSRQRNAEGDYTPDAKASRFPEWQAPSGTNAKSPAPRRWLKAVSLSGLVEDWWKEARKAGRSVSTYESYRNAMRKVIEFLGHDDASRVTKADLLAFKGHRLASGVSPKTVKDSDFVGLKTVFKHAVDNEKLEANPTEGITFVRQKAAEKRSKAFTQDEALSILRHASSHRPARNESPKMTAAKRWAPWLCAYTGARVGEVVQLRKQDVRHEGTLVVITITPEAGTVKDKRVREVVLHAHLLELGFMDFVEKSAPGHLFLKVAKGADIRGPWRSAKNRVTTFVREVLVDRDVAPNHGWRHLFKTVGREAGIDSLVLDAITGHAPATVGGSYGDVTFATKAKAMRSFPRFGDAEMRQRKNGEAW